MILGDITKKVRVNRKKKTSEDWALGIFHHLEAGKMGRKLTEEWPGEKGAGQNKKQKKGECVILEDN